ncbi:MAG: anaerobic ribonucleoside-triphosphate reductase activating protein [Eubacteriales bacterium]|nr:anaerobic ribonucleoside-triphosphate reductase activating protein [Eubacteriales bacterium]
MKIAGIQKSSTIDFPGNLACVLFTTGCDLSCFYCHNRALLDGGAPVLPMEEVMAFLNKRQGLLDGVVVSGGEPTLQSDLYAFIEMLKGMEYAVKLDTNGRDPALVARLLAANLLDYAAVDFKAPKSEYPWVTGSDTAYAAMQKTLALLRESGISYEVRTTLYPGLTQEQLTGMLQSLPPVPKYRLNFFRMPEAPRPQDALLLSRHALAPGEIKAMDAVLREAQPHLEY